MPADPDSNRDRSSLSKAARSTHDKIILDRGSGQQQQPAVGCEAGQWMCGDNVRMIVFMFSLNL
jgi:hypothetical protein